MSNPEKKTTAGDREKLRSNRVSQSAQRQVSTKRSNGRGNVTKLAARLVGLVLALFVALIIWGVFTQYRTETATDVVRSEFGDADDFSSVNGFAVLQKMLERQGCEVTTTSLLTPQLNKQDVLIWFHNSDRLPQPEAFERVEQWLAEDYRTLIFVGNDHNAKPEFLEAVYRSSELKDREWARVVSRLEMSRELKTLHMDQMPTMRRAEFLRYQTGQGCDWFSVSNAPVGFVGQWSIEPPDSQPTQVDLPSIRVRQYLKPNVSDYETLAACSNDEKELPLVYRFEGDNYGSDIVIVSSAAFLTNYGTVQPENRPLVMTLLRQIPANSDVQILESGPQRVPLSSTPEDRMVKTWSWMKHGLFPIAVLHVLAFAVIFCFARFPVFGRPKEVDFEPRNDFGLHLEEVGRLLRNGKQESFAREKIRHYFEIVKRSLIGRGPSSRL